MCPIQFYKGVKITRYFYTFLYEIFNCEALEFLPLLFTSANSTKFIKISFNPDFCKIAIVSFTYVSTLKTAALEQKIIR